MAVVNAAKKQAEESKKKADAEAKAKNDWEEYLKSARKTVEDQDRQVALWKKLTSHQEDIKQAESSSVKDDKKVILIPLQSGFNAAHPESWKSLLSSLGMPDLNGFGGMSHSQLYDDYEDFDENEDYDYDEYGNYDDYEVYYEY